MSLTTEQVKILEQTRLAQLFWSELSDSTDSLGAIAEQHGVRTLAYLFYLQNAILDDGFIDLTKDDPGTPVLAVVHELPSANLWAKHIRSID
ncbi:hypothetical protein MCEMSEM18_03605 [Comamonadaceae bacterium]